MLNASWFDTIEIARAATRLWRRDYNEKRPHRSLGNKTPKEYAAQASERSAAEKSQ
jgi:putative transposase